MFQHILFKNDAGVLRINLNRPEVHHALNFELINEITQAINIAATDVTVRAVVITGEGSKAFCSGADLKAVMSSGKSTGDVLRTYYNPLIQSLRNLPKPVICRLNGLAAGAGASLALACDLIIASEQAYLTQIFVQIGLMPDAGATFFLPRLVGMARAFELASTGRPVYGPEAASMGLIHRSVSATELDQAVEEAVVYYRQAPTQAIGRMKQILNQSCQSDLTRMLELEAVHQDELSRSNDAQEGILSFIQKKKPDYQGH
jgi:2-(1,2-epoxy-1,2-dihydrophenyl)acetyl-CoA isomerase